MPIKTDLKPKGRRRKISYLIIDEYDQGANDVLATSLKSFQELTKSGGVLKPSYASLKDLATTGPIARVFITA